MKNRVRILFILPALLALLTFQLQLSTACAQGTAFTYQGQLQNNGAPSSGTYNLQFLLYTNAAGGTAVAGPVVTNGVVVSNGLFTVTMDFGASAFSGATNWLQIGVETNGFSSFSTLAPRQQLTPTPYAIYAENENMLANGVGIGAGAGNTVSSSGATDSFIGGGSGNGVLSGSVDSTVAGGQGNIVGANAGWSTIAGGDNNQSYSGWGAIGGGGGNVISNNAPFAVLAGGENNLISPNAQLAVISGGFANTNGGQFAVVPGGANNFALGNYSYAAGNRAKATNQGSFVWADSQNADFGSTASNQFSVRAGGGVHFVTSGAGVTLDGQSVLAGTVAESQINDGGAAAYQSFQQTVQSVGGDTAVPFAALAPVTATNGMPASFAFTLNGSAFGSVIGFSGEEGMSQPYFYAVEVQSSGAAVNPDAQIGLNGRLTYTRNGRSTSFAGIITACTLSASNSTSPLYTFRVESPLALMSFTTDYHIFQNTNAPVLAAAVYNSATAGTATENLTTTYTLHDNLVQFGETDLNFFSRILAYEGIFYFFNQNANPPSLMLGDNVSAYLASPNSPFPYYGNLNTNISPGAEYIQTFQKASHQSTLSSTVSAYNFTIPSVLQSAMASGAEGTGSNYEFGSSSVQTTAYNQLIAQVRQDAQTAARSAIAGSGTAPDLRAGYTFTLNDQTGAGLGGSYLVTSIHHAGFVRVTNGVSTLFYGNEFQAVPASLNYRPPLATPKPQATPSIAVVTGAAGEEIDPDKYGRVKVQFKWDRYGNSDENSSAWIRMTSPMAGSSGRGIMFLPRIGDEVLVTFVEGDPDQPIIIGSLYNANNTPPYTLPDNKAISTIRSTGTIGQPSEINEIKFDDTAGAQSLSILGARDLILRSVNNATFTVGSALNAQTAGNATLTVGSTLSMSATADATLNADNNLTLRAASGNAMLSAGGSLNIQAGSGTALTGPATIIGSLSATNEYVGGLSVTNGMNIDQANLNSGNDSANALTFGAGSGEGIGSQRTSGANQYDLVLYTAFNPRLTVLNNGNVGIGTTAPAALLDVEGNQTGTFANGTVVINNSNNTVSAGPALRVTWSGTASGNPDGLAALSVSANNLTGEIAEFGNADTWVTTILNDGTVNATAFNTTSDRNAKTNLAPVSPATVLARVAALPISEWNFKADPADQRHLGPMAQDFHAAFGLNGSDDRHISVVDEGGVALAAIQGLNLKLEDEARKQTVQIQSQSAEIERLKRQNDSLTSRLDDLTAMVRQLQQRNATP